MILIHLTGTESCCQMHMDTVLDREDLTLGKRRNYIRKRGQRGGRQVSLMGLLHLWQPSLRGTVCDLIPPPTLARVGRGVFEPTGGWM